MDTVIVGARGSRLAQAMVAEFLAHLGGPCPVVKFKNRVVMTDGDRDRQSPLSEVSAARGSGAFSNQLERELLEGRIDIAVHSLKCERRSGRPGRAARRGPSHICGVGSPPAGYPTGARLPPDDA